MDISSTQSQFLQVIPEYHPQGGNIPAYNTTEEPYLPPQEGDVCFEHEGDILELTEYEETNGIVNFNKVISKEALVVDTFQEGIYIKLGIIDKKSGIPPSEEQVKKGIRTYEGHLKLQNMCKVAIIVSDQGPKFF